MGWGGGGVGRQVGIKHWCSTTARTETVLLMPMTAHALCHADDVNC